MRFTLDVCLANIADFIRGKGRIFIVAFFCTGLMACATVVRGTSESFSIITDPEGAQVTTTLETRESKKKRKKDENIVPAYYKCQTTPCTLKLPRKSTFDVTISKQGYKTITHHIGHEVSTGGGAGLAGNALFGGIIGIGVDAGTGAMYDLTPSPLELALEPVSPGAITESGISRQKAKTSDGHALPDS